MNEPIFKWKCPECKKEIVSLNETQFDYNKRQHIQKHERNKIKEKTNG